MSKTVEAVSVENNGQCVTFERGENGAFRVKEATPAPLEAANFESVNWNSIVDDYYVLVGYNFSSQSAIETIVNRFESEFKRRFYCALQARRKANKS
jgi:hypothetical protein